MREEEKYRGISETFHNILRCYFDRSEIIDFTQKINRLVPGEDHIDSKLSEDLDSNMISGSFFSDKYRMLIDQILTFAASKLEGLDYLKFIKELDTI